MRYPALTAAWGVLLLDNVPAQIRPSTEESFEAMLPKLMMRFDETDLGQAEQALASLEQPELEDLCMGDEDDQEAATQRMTTQGYFGTHASQVVAEMFELV